MSAPDSPSMNDNDPVDPSSETAAVAPLSPEARDASDAPPVEDAPVPPPGPHEARGGSYFRNVRYVIFLAILGMGGWFMYDGFVKWPNENTVYERLKAEVDLADDEGRDTDRKDAMDEMVALGIDGPDKPHSDLSILLQKVLGFTLPPIGLVLLIRWLYISRGVVRLDENDVLHAPGHPPVAMDDVKEIDDRQWERKGISHIGYSVDGSEGSVKLDDFVYERAPIDAIHDRLVHLKKDA
ncbi:MAG: hypothetical protein AAF561_16815 [Planctomycetota bacterium]